MKPGSTLIAFVAASIVPTLARAHFSLSGDTELGRGIWVFYGLFFGAIAAFIVYRKWRNGNDAPERRALKHRLADLERDLKSPLAQLRFADDYPREYELTEKQRRQHLESAAAIRRRIEGVKIELSRP